MNRAEREEIANIVFEKVKKVLPLVVNEELRAMHAAATDPLVLRDMRVAVNKAVYETLAREARIEHAGARAELALKFDEDLEARLEAELRARGLSEIPELDFDV